MSENIQKYHVVNILTGEKTFFMDTSFTSAKTHVELFLSRNARDNYQVKDMTGLYTFKRS